MTERLLLLRGGQLAGTFNRHGRYNRLAVAEANKVGKCLRDLLIYLSDRFGLIEFAYRVLPRSGKVQRPF